MRTVTRSCWRTKMRVGITFSFDLNVVLIRCTADEERVFLIGEELEFRSSERDGDPTLVWRDIDGDVDEAYEFIAAGTNEPTHAFFETCIYRAMYERKYRKSAENTQDANLDEFIWV
jgi:hypothetical protein